MLTLIQRGGRRVGDDSLQEIMGFQELEFASNASAKGAVGAQLTVGCQAGAEVCGRLAEACSGLGFALRAGTSKCWQLGSEESNQRNQQRFEMGELKHKPPTFEFFDPTEAEKLAVWIKEIKLPLAMQTHEVRTLLRPFPVASSSLGPRSMTASTPSHLHVPCLATCAQVCYEPVTQCMFISQMSNSVLVRIPIGTDGFLADEQDAWRVGDSIDLHPDSWFSRPVGVSGMHSISLSKAHEGCLWISLQYSNQLMLVDVRPRRMLVVRQLLQVCPCSATSGYPYAQARMLSHAHAPMSVHLCPHAYACKLVPAHL